MTLALATCDNWLGVGSVPFIILVTIGGLLVYWSIGALLVYAVLRYQRPR